MIWIRRILAGGAALMVVAVLLAFTLSEWRVRRTVAMPLPAIEAAHDPAQIAEGARVATFEGCRACHGDRGQGRVIQNDAMIGRIVAPALARVAARATDAELARVIRHGVSVSGKPIYIMPSDVFNRLADEDVARILGWIRTLRPASGDVTVSTRLGPLLRFALATGGLNSAVNPAGDQPRARPGDVGGYYVGAPCSFCHAPDHDRIPPGGFGPAPAPPPPQGAAAPDPAPFPPPPPTGEGAGGGAPPPPKGAATKGFKGFTVDEIDAIHAYLREEAARLQPS